MRLKTSLVLAVFFVCGLLPAQQILERKPANAAFAKFDPVRAPRYTGKFLKKGDRLAVCGDSITEQKMYSRIMEDYLTVCAPELQVSVRQYGWSGERADGFLRRMTNDCLRFQPTVATTCYGMNDHQYRPYQEAIGEAYRRNSDEIIESFKVNHVRVVQGSPGCVGKMPGWVKEASGTVEDLNLSLCKLRNIGIDLAEKEKVRFADVFWPMFTAGVQAQMEYGTNYAIAGRDGVHPDWAGHTVMAYAFLKSLGVKGSIGTLIVNLDSGRMRTSEGHALVSATAGNYTLKSSRYPFCPCLEGGQAAEHFPVCGQDDVSRDNSIRSAMTLVPFNQDLNRFMLIGKKGKAQKYTVTWGSESRTFSEEQLNAGVNLAAEFPCNPFCPAFAKVDAAVAAKQAFETRQVKQVFHGAEGKADMAQAVSRTEREREPLVEAIKAAFVPVTHTLTIKPL